MAEEYAENHLLISEVHIFQSPFNFILSIRLLSFDKLRTMIKRLVILLVVLLSTTSLAEATHVAGGNITYVNIGPNTYRIRLTLIRDCSGATLGQSAQVTSRNNCNVNGPSTTVTLLAGSGAEIPTPCTNDPSRCLDGTRYGVQKYEYEGIVTLPASPVTCQLWYFGYSLCCRNSSSTIVGQPNFFIESMVNNGAGINNSSAYFNTFQVPAFCILEPVNVFFNVDELNGDSLVFSLTPARISTVGNAPYQAGFTPTQPVSGTPPVVNQNNGNLSFISTMPQNAVIVVTVTEWRNGVVVGIVSFDVQLVLGTGRYCDNITPSFQSDSLSRACSQDLNLTVRLNTLVECNTVTTNASEFRLYYPDGRLVPIVSAFADSCTLGRTRVIRLVLGRPMEINGFYYMVSRKGTDGDTFGNQCQRYMVEFDTLVYQVTGCPEYDIPMDLLNVTVDSVNQNVTELAWSDPVGLNYNWLNAFLVWRKNPINGIYDRVRYTDNSPAARKFADYEPNLFPKDGSVSFKVNLGLNNGVRNPLSNELSTIHLIDTPGDIEDNLDLTLAWSPYAGWPNPVYTVQFKDEQRDFPVGWQYPEQNASTTDTFITFEKPILPGLYLARVLTLDPNGVYKSYSNWVTFKVKARDLKIPNVITPNGDGVNDVFVVENLEYYINGSLKVFNRWGQQVYESLTYLNNWSPNELEGGTYFYQMVVQKDQTVTQTFNGALEIVK